MEIIDRNSKMIPFDETEWEEFYTKHFFHRGGNLHTCFVQKGKSYVRVLFPHMGKDLTLTYLYSGKYFRMEVYATTPVHDVGETILYMTLEVRESHNNKRLGSKFYP